jgi:DNA repair exonuclease SbcCD ATPase subunit
MKHATILQASVDTMALMEPRVLELLSGIQEQMAAQRAWQDAQTRNVERFWSQDWPRVVDNIERLANRIDKIEMEIATVTESRIKISDHESRLRELEKVSMRLSTQAAIIAAIVGLAAPLLGKFIMR